MRLFLLLLLPLTLPAQTPLDADFRFPGGVYLSHAALLALEPDLPWEATTGERVQLPDDYRVQIQHYGYRDTSLAADLLPYAVVLDGFVYLFVRHDVERDFYDFAGLRVLGALSTFQYDTKELVKKLITAYNPRNGQPFREAYVEREITVTHRKVLEMSTGKVVNANLSNLLLLCADDPDIVKALSRLSDPGYDMLLRAVKLYDDRHVIELPR